MVDMPTAVARPRHIRQEALAKPSRTMVQRLDTRLTPERPPPPRNAQGIASL